VFATVSADGRTHAHRIYVAAEGAGKAELGTGPDGRPREAKKSAKVSDGARTSGYSAIWGDPSRAPQLLLAEGIETATALASTFVVEIALLEIAVAAGISATGLEAFQPYPATQKITICADRDEADKANGSPGSRRGEKAARKFGLLNHERLKVEIALPGKTGETVDWLDVFRAEGPRRCGPVSKPPPFSLRPLSNWRNSPATDPGLGICRKSRRSIRFQRWTSCTSSTLNGL
jgi:hypothetical protein